ncbi:MAG: phosphotriesterase family protein [Marvinbryantia sp.]|jgi:predicted metal-dependent phosphotriesterase family hydrolase
MKKGKIHSVTGVVDPAERLFFQSHEHLLIGQGHSGEINSALCFEDYEKSLQELKAYHLAGGEALTDAQPVGCGRMAAELQRLSEESKVVIVASTGFHKMLFYPEGHWNFTLSETMLADIYINELTVGMYQDSDMQIPSKQILAQAGQIKTAIEASVMDVQYQKLFSAAAYAAVETGAPFMIHVENGCSPEKYLDFLIKKGVKPEQMIFCHMDRACTDLGLHKAFARAGVFLEYDTIAREKYHSDERELEIFHEMIEEGLEDRLLFSLDTTRQRMKFYGGEVGLDYILKTFLGKMKDSGIPQSIIKKFSRDNPSQAFAWMH